MKDENQRPQTIYDYIRIKKLRIFSVLRRLKFSGQVVWKSPENKQWILFFNSGKLVYAAGGIHPVRRWYRHVQAQLPKQDLSYAAVQQAIQGQPELLLTGCWDYQILYHWLQLGIVSQKSLQHICRHILRDVLFDIVQAENTRYELIRQAPLPFQLVPIDILESELFEEVKKLAEDWFHSDVSHYSPNLAPVINHPEPIRAEVSPQVFESLMRLLDGQRSLHDLSVKLGKDVLNLTSALYPYIKSGWISLNPLADFSVALEPLDTKEYSSNATSPPLIACVDDSLLVCKSMGQVIRAASYDFLFISEGAKAVPILLSKNPNLIFLDLVMPDTNGYEICSQLRKTSRFKETPIIILSGNDGLVDQVRARLLGATDFLSKPIEPIIILSVIRKHLGQIAYAYGFK